MASLPCKFRAVDLLPVNRDPVNGAHVVEFLALTYAWSGEPALACDQLEIVRKISGQLELRPIAAFPPVGPAARNPRFGKIVACLARGVIK